MTEDKDAAAAAAAANVLQVAAKAAASVLEAANRASISHLCIHEERWGNVATDLADIKVSLKEISVKLFVGNGQPALSMRVDRSEQTLKALIWGVGVLGVAVVGEIVTAIVKAIGK